MSLWTTRSETTMTEYAHNHPPRCCCHSWPIADETDRYIVCELCPEHGELAQLSNDNSPKTIQAHTGERIYACCAQLVGRPHTDYCPAGRGITPEMQELGERMIADEIANTAADRGAHFGMTHVPETHTLDGDTHPVHQCHPDRCGMWATQTTQPASQTSTPTTQTRGYPKCATCPGAFGCPPGQCEPTPHATPTPGQAIHPNCGHPDWPDCPHHT